MLPDTAAVAMVVMYLTSLARQIADSAGFAMTRAATLLFLIIAAPLVALGGYYLDAVPVDGWRAAVLLGTTAVPVAVGMYEGAKTVTSKGSVFFTKRDAP